MNSHCHNMTTLMLHPVPNTTAVMLHPVPNKIWPKPHNLLMIPYYHLQNHTHTFAVKVGE